MQFKWQFRLRPSMLGLFVVLVLPLMVALVLLTYMSTNEAVSRTAQAMAERFNAQVVKNIQQAIDPIASLTSGIAVMASTEPDYFRRDTSWEYLRATVEHSDDISGAYFAYNDGSFRAVYRVNGSVVFFWQKSASEFRMGLSLVEAWLTRHIV